MADLSTGADSTGVADERVGNEEYNDLKNNFRGATLPANRQPGMTCSRNTDDRLSHRVSASQDYLIFQGEPVCANNVVVCANNQVVVVLPV